MGGLRAKRWEAVRRILLAGRIAVVLGFCWFLILANSGPPGDSFVGLFDRGSGENLVTVDSACVEGGASGTVKILPLRDEGTPTDGFSSQGQDTGEQPAGGPPCMYVMEGAESFGLPECIMEAGTFEHIGEATCGYQPRSEKFSWLQGGSVGGAEVECRGSRKDYSIHLDCAGSGGGGKACSAELKLPEPVQASPAPVSPWPNGNLGLSCTLAANRKIYCFGGSGNRPPYTLDKIVEFNPVDQTFIEKQARLPSPRTHLSCAAADDGKIYCFGGSGGGNFLDEIVSFDPESDSIYVETARLPGGLYGPSCSLGIDKKIYCFGGLARGRLQLDVLRYEPGVSAVSATSARLRRSLDGLSCTPAVNGRIYCFGGSDDDGDPKDTAILEYDPWKDALNVLAASLPSPRSMLSCVSTANSKIYCFGGARGLPVREILEFDTSTASVTVKSAVLQGQPHSVSCVFFPPDKVYCIGGGSPHFVEYSVIALAAP